MIAAYLMLGLLGADRSMLVELNQGMTDLDIGVYWRSGVLVQLPDDCSVALAGVPEDLSVNRVGDDSHNTLMLRPIRVRAGAPDRIGVVCADGARLFSLVLNYVSRDEATETIQIVNDKGVSVQEEKLRASLEKKCEADIETSKHELRSAIEDEVTREFVMGMMERLFPLRKPRSSIGDGIAVKIPRGVMGGKDVIIYAVVKPLKPKAIELETVMLSDPETGLQVEGKLYDESELLTLGSEQRFGFKFSGVGEGLGFASKREFDVVLKFRGGAKVKLRKLDF